MSDWLTPHESAWQKFRTRWPDENYPLAKLGGRAVHRKDCRIVEGYLAATPPNSWPVAVLAVADAESSAWLKRCRVCAPDFIEKRPAPWRAKDARGRFTT